MGIIRYLLDKRFTKRTNVNILHPFWDVAEDKDKIVQPGILVDAFRNVAISSDVNKMFKIIALRDHPDPVDTIFTYTTNNIPAEDHIKLAELIAASDAFTSISAYSASLAMRSLSPMAENCPPEEKLRLLHILEESGKLTHTLPRTGADLATRFYVDIFKEVATEDAIAHLRALKSWRSLDHKNETFIEWVYHRDERLAPAIIKS